MKVTLSGKTTELPDNISIAQLLNLKNMEPGHTVVELRGEVVLSDQWDSTIIHDGDALEILSFVGGG